MVQTKLHITVPDNVKKMLEDICADTNLKPSAVITVALTEYYKTHYAQTTKPVTDPSP